MPENPTFLERAKAQAGGTATSYILSSIRNTLLGSPWNVGIADPTFYVAEHASDEELRAGIQEQGIRNQESLDLWRQQKQYEFERQQIVNNDFVGELFALILDPVSWIAFGKAFQVLKFYRLTHKILVGRSLRTMKLVDTATNVGLASGFESLVTDSTKAVLGDDPRFTHQNIAINAAISLVAGAALGALTGAIQIRVMPSRGLLYKSKAISLEEFNKLRKGGFDDEFIGGIAKFLPIKSYTIKGDEVKFILDGASTVKSEALEITASLKALREEPNLANTLAHVFNENAEFRLDAYGNTFIVTHENGKRSIFGRKEGDTSTEVRLVNAPLPIARTADDVISTISDFTTGKITKLRVNDIPQTEYRAILIDDAILRIAVNSGQQKHLQEAFNQQAAVLTWGRKGDFPNVDSIRQAVRNAENISFQVTTQHSPKILVGQGKLIQINRDKYVLLLPDVKRLQADAGIVKPELRISQSDLGEGGITLRVTKTDGDTLIPDLPAKSTTQHYVNKEGLNVFDIPGYAKIVQGRKAETLIVRPDVPVYQPKRFDKVKGEKLLKENTKALREYAARVHEGLEIIPKEEHLQSIGFFNYFTQKQFDTIFSFTALFKDVSKIQRGKIQDNLTNMTESLFSVAKLGKIDKQNVFNGVEGLSKIQQSEIVRKVDKMLAEIHENLNITPEQRTRILSNVNGSPEEKGEMLLSIVKLDAVMTSERSFILSKEQYVWAPTRLLNSIIRVINTPFDKSFGSLLTRNDPDMKRLVRTFTKQGGIGGISISSVMQAFFSIPLEDSIRAAMQVLRGRTLPVWKVMQSEAKKSGLKDPKIKDITVEIVLSVRGGTGFAAQSAKDILARVGLSEGHQIRKSVDALLVELRSKSSEGLIYGIRNPRVPSVLILDKLALSEGMRKGGFLWNNMLNYISNPSQLSPLVLRNARPDQRIGLLSKALLSEQRLDGLRNDFTQWLYKNNKQNLLRIMPNDPEYAFMGTLRLDVHRQAIYKLMGTEDIDTAKILLGNLLNGRGFNKFDIKVALQRFHSTSGSPYASDYGIARGNATWKHAIRNIGLLVGSATLRAGGVWDLVDGLYRTVVTGSTLTTQAMAKPFYRAFNGWRRTPDGKQATGLFNPDGTPEILNKKNSVKAFASAQRAVRDQLVEFTEGSGSFFSRAVELAARFTNVLTLNAFTTSFILRYSANHFDEVMYKFAKVLRNGIDKGHITRNDIIANNEAFKKYLLRVTTANERSFASELGMTGEQVLQMGDDVTLAYGNLKVMRDLQNLDIDKLVDISPESARLYFTTRNRVGQNAALFASTGERMPFLNPDENRILSQFVNFMQSAHFNRLNSALTHENGGLVLGAITAHALLSTALVDGLIDIREKNESAFFKKIQNSNDVKRVIHGLSESAIPGLFAYFAQPISIHLQTGQGVDRLFSIPSLERGLDLFGTFLTFGDNLEHKEPSQALKKLGQDLLSFVPVIHTIGYELSAQSVQTILEITEDS